MNTNSQKTIPNFTLLTGKETYLVDKYRTELIEKITSTFQTNNLPIQVIVNEGSKISPIHLQEVLSNSMFAEIEILVFSDVDKIPEKCINIFASYLQNPVAEKYIIFQAESISKNKPLVSLVNTAAIRSIDFPALTKDTDRLQFIKKSIESLGGIIDKQTAQLLLDYLGNDLQTLDMACRQLFLDGDGLINKELVDKYYGGNAKITVFNLMDSIFTEKLEVIREQLFWILRLGVAPLIVVDTIGQTLQEIALVYGNNGRNLVELSKDSGIPSWRLKKALVRARKIRNPGTLDKLLEESVLLNYAAKGGNDTPIYAIEKFITDMYSLINKPN